MNEVTTNTIQIFQLRFTLYMYTNDMNIQKVLLKWAEKLPNPIQPPPPPPP